VGYSSFLFVNAHFAAHQTKVNERNLDYKKIASLTSLRCSKTASVSPRGSSLSVPCEPEAPSSPTLSETQNQDPCDGPTGVADTTNCFDLVAWMGDLNYRINGERHMVDLLLKDAEYRDVLLANDQLLAERRKGNVFAGFQEGAINFPPTYKYHKSEGLATEVYDQSEKRRIPAWTDRILFKLNTQEETFKLYSYGSIDSPSLRTSDHRPVTADVSFETAARPADVAPVILNQTASRTCLIC
jgi:hypothetical protein